MAQDQTGSTESPKPLSVGVLTGGGDCPGLNAVIRGVVRKAEKHYGDRVVGFLDGWKGVIENDFMELTIDACRGILPRGGTILGTTRITPFMVEDGMAKVKATMSENDLDALIVIGGEGTLSCALATYNEGLPVVGVPKTIDNDIGGTERTFGFDTAVAIATEAIDRLHTTAESHDRVMVCEVMGRHVGHIATWAGIAGGATMTLIPEHPFDVQIVCDALVRRHENGRFASIVVVAEGATPAPGTIDLPKQEVDRYGHIRLGGIGHILAGEIEQRTGLETRVTTLGHIQRGGTPTPFDRVLSTRFGVAAIDAVHTGHFGHMVALRSASITPQPLVDCVSELKYVSDELYDVATQFFA